MQKFWNVFKVAFVVLVFVFVALQIVQSVKNNMVVATVAPQNYGGTYGEMGAAAGSSGIGLSSGGVVNSIRSMAKGVMSESSAPVYDSASPNVSPNPSGATTDRMIIKTGFLSVVVKDVKDSIKAVSEYAVKQGGFVVSSDVSKQGLAPYGTVTVRVPVNKFDQGLADVKALGESVSEQVNGQDVTEEYVDLDAQMRNLRATETQFLSILSKATQIQDILAVQRELTNVRSDIERLQGRMKYLKQSADLSTITVNFSTDPSVLPAYEKTPQWRPWAEVKSAARALLEMGKGLVNTLIWLAIFIPVWALVGLVIWLIYKIYNRFAHHRNDQINLMK